ncbi:9-O-acetylesterase [Pseudoxanthomonas broegbernensis]|uniref:9-O-acetylesterase n=2 Tax=Pseudoxanthomonas broegbernensis TaxID=83619 RepID=A0A7V8GKU8_9GAMM|nr:sialate O-acetylesterase [Pseudoxanthomonas broegbernensis]KAF1685373.1 9-O-acetylesterase [Pseudoxanthomonas broegbernensis]
MAAAPWLPPAVAAQAAGTAPLLHALFQDHAVLQRDQPLRVWGLAPPGQTVQVELAGKRASARADGDGRWEATLPALKAGGPYTLSAAAGQARQTVADVLVGDVWLCSGQSNMELQVWRSLDARAEIAGAGNDRIRLLAVPQVSGVAPQATFSTPVQWRAVDPESVRDFSAACYFFARELQKTVDVPMGLINAAWGGSRIEAWIGAPALRTLGRYAGELDILERYAAEPMDAVGDWGRFWQRWWSGRPAVAAGDTPWDADQGSQWRAAPEQLGAWERWGVPELAAFDGMVWYRTGVTLSAAQAAQGAVLALGPADEIDMTWVNGQGVGSTYGAGGGREYRLPAGLLREGRNEVVVNVLDTYRDGGLSGPASQHALHLADGSSVPLEAQWQYRIVPAEVGSPPRAPWQSAAGLSTLYNGMIAPLGRYGLRGALWYQGESNTGEPELYADLLRTLRRDWRERFGAGLPLLVVQLANYGARPSAPTESGWAQLREAQRQVATEDSDTGLVVAIDIGDAYDIHPTNKQELGRRLARAARHVAYGQALPASGPVPLAAGRNGEAVVVSFGDVEGALVAYGAPGPIGFELCGEAAGSCHYAQAQVWHNRVTLQAPDAHQATRVRYCWGDSPTCTLFDANGDGPGMPAGPFQIPLSPMPYDDHAR